MGGLTPLGEPVSTPRTRWWAAAVAAIVVAGLAVAALRYFNRPDPDAPAASAPPGPAARPARTRAIQVMPPRPDIPPLQEDPNFVDLADPAAPVDPVVFLEAPDIYGSNVFEKPTGLLRREMYRQGLLMAARDGLGLTVRDGTLGEEPPEDLRLTNRLRVNARFVVARKHELKVECGPAAASRVVWRAAGTMNALREQEPAEALSAAEELSRGGFLTALKRAGLRGTPTKLDPTAAVPEEAERRLGEMTFTAQFAALRLLHAAVRDRGESPALLTALARAYANLGMLTDRQWDNMTWVFKARGLLYAERLRQRDPKSAAGHWARAYAAALAGMHAVALADLKEADRVCGEAAPPAWAVLADDLCRFDSAKLKAAAAAGGPLADTARVFHFLTVESYAGARRGAAVGEEVLRAIPECYRVFDGAYDLAGVRGGVAIPVDGSRIFTDTFPARVAEMPGVPATVADRAQAGSPEPDLVKGLTEAGRSRDDRGEPTWAAVAQFARETRLLLVIRRLRDLRSAGPGPVTEALAEVRPLVADHPLYPFLETYAIDPDRQPVEYQRRVRGVKIPELTYRHTDLLRALMFLGPDERVRYSHFAITHGDWLYYDGYLVIRVGALEPDRNYSPVARRLLKTSPYSPLARAGVLRFDDKLSEAEAAAWEKEAQHPEVFLALARRALARKQPAEAEGYARKALELSADRDTYRVLAESYKARGDEDKWLAALEEFLKDAPGRDNARVRVEIANHFLAKKDYHRAQPYAADAAGTGDGSAMLCASRCAEGLEEWADAEEWVRRTAEQFPDVVDVWWYWCLRTGRGDLPAAEKLVEDHLARVGPPRAAADFLMTAVRHVAGGRPAKAADTFLAAHAKSPQDLYLLLAAAEYDAAGDRAARDGALRGLAPKGPPDKGPYGSGLAFLRDRILRAGPEPPGAAEIEAALKPLHPAARSDAWYLVGRALRTRGHTKLADEYFGRCAAEPVSAFTVAPVLAGIALRSPPKK
jgi:tetratricopeptide (TPR) repeat protein